MFSYDFYQSIKILKYNLFQKTEQLFTQKTMTVGYMDFRFGTLVLTQENGFLTRLSVQKDSTGILNKTNNNDALIKEALRQLQAYFDKRLTAFDLPFAFNRGTAFQKRVWQTLTTIPYGQTASYKDIANRLENPLACRAVGQSNRHNPLPIIIPCHRVVAKNNIGGYAFGSQMKRYLLDLEKAPV